MPGKVNPTQCKAMVMVRNAEQFDRIVNPAAIVSVPGPR